MRRDRVFPCGYRSGNHSFAQLGGAAYILWLAWKIATSPAADEKVRPKPVGFWVSFGLQFVNVKIILYGITALSTFVLPQTQALNWVIGVSILLALIGTFGNVCWALAGHLFQRAFRHYGRQLNIILALLLVYCAVRIFTDPNKTKAEKARPLPLVITG